MLLLLSSSHQLSKDAVQKNIFLFLEKSSKRRRKEDKKEKKEKKTKSVDHLESSASSQERQSTGIRDRQPPLLRLS